MTDLKSKPMMAMAVAAGVSLIALAAPVAAFSPLQDAEVKEDKKVVVIKKKGDGGKALTWTSEDGKTKDINIAKNVIAFMDDDGKQEIIITKKVEDGKETIDIKGGEIVSTSEDGNTYVVKDKNGKEHTITMNMDKKHKVWTTAPGKGKRMSMKKWVGEDGTVMDLDDGDGNVFVMKGMAPHAGKPMVWTSKGDMKAPMMWRGRDDGKRGAAVAELDEALADVEEQLANLKDNKRNKKARAALGKAKESLISAKEMLSDNEHNVFQFRTNTMMMNDVVDENMLRALKDVEMQSEFIVELREELHEEIEEANEEMNEIIIELKSEENGELREVHLKAIEEAKMDMAEMEEVRLKALKDAEKNLRKAREKLEKKIADRKAAKKKEDA